MVFIEGLKGGINREKSDHWLDKNGPINSPS